jgi:Threonine dehydrogenase and related Zn-dependent dehydrogenases
MKMLAAVFEGIENIKVREVDVPKCERDGMLVKVISCGICGGDIRNYHTGLRDGVKEQVMGHEIAGIVTEIGSDVTAYQVDDRIAIAPDVSCGECYYCRRGLVNLCVRHRMLGTHWPGGFAQYVYLNHEILQRGFVYKLPDDLDFDAAAMAEPAASVVACQERFGIGLGDTVVIIGDGPIGCLHVEIARARGATKIILVGLAKLSTVPQFEPDHIIDAGNCDPVAVVRELTDGLGADFVICANPVAKTQEQAVEMSRKRGTVILFGGVSKQNPLTTLNSNLIHYNEIIVAGTFSYPAKGLEDAVRMIASGKISPEKYVTSEVNLHNIPEGIAFSEAGKALKVVVKPWQ